MGTYAEFYFKAKLRKDTHGKVLYTLQQLMAFELLKLNHEFFECERVEQLFHSTNGNDYCSGMSLTKQGDYPLLEIHTEFKNYDSEIEKFIDWISPYVVGRKKKQYVGYYNYNIWEIEKQNIYITR